jgi:hypothetical protein
MKNTPRNWFLAVNVLAGAAFAAPAMADTAQPAPVHHTRHHVRHVTHHAAIAPLAPASPAPQPVAADNTAPMPNESVTAPIPKQDEDPTMAPAVMQIHYPPMGDGYTTGSSAQAMDDREAAKVTGVQIKMPLGQ